jgi:hypothetical protein
VFFICLIRTTRSLQYPILLCLHRIKDTTEYEVVATPHYEDLCKRGVLPPNISTLGLDGCEFHPLPSIRPRYRILGIRTLEGWGNPNAGLDNFKMLFASSHDTDPSFSVAHSQPSRCTKWIMKSKRKL